MGCDQKAAEIQASINEFQSTHPHGVRPSRCAMPSILHSFNPRTHMGCDRRILPIHVYVLKFQSTHPHGVRPCLIQIVCNPWSFNPRTHMGCDLPQSISRDNKMVSIHAPTWGATSHCPLYCKVHKCFNPRTHMGCDLIDYLVFAT